jgi:hypothetical protein
MVGFGEEAVEIILCRILQMFCGFYYRHINCIWSDGFGFFSFLLLGLLLRSWNHKLGLIATSLDAAGGP